MNDYFNSTDWMNHCDDSYYDEDLYYDGMRCGSDDDDNYFKYSEIDFDECDCDNY